MNEETKEPNCVICRLEGDLVQFDFDEFGNLEEFGRYFTVAETDDYNTIHDKHFVLSVFDSTTQSSQLLARWELSSSIEKIIEEGEFENIFKFFLDQYKSGEYDKETLH